MTSPNSTVAALGIWKDKGGAAVKLLLMAMVEARFPEIAIPETVPGMVAWTDQDRFAAALTEAGLGDLQFHEVTNDFQLDLPILLEPERVFQFSQV